MAGQVDPVLVNPVVLLHEIQDLHDVPLAEVLRPPGVGVRRRRAESPPIRAVDAISERRHHDVTALFGEHRNETLEFWVLVLSIGLSFWVQYARTVRGSTLVEKSKDYVLAARLIGIHPAKILFRHVLPNVIGPVLVIATINLALAIITEATLSFLGVGLPPTQPSLGTLIRIGNNFLFAGEWWIAIFPGITLALLVVAINLLGDWLRDALNPRLQ